MSHDPLEIIQICWNYNFFFLLYIRLYLLLPSLHITMLRSLNCLTAFRCLTYPSAMHRFSPFWTHQTCFEISDQNVRVTSGAQVKVYVMCAHLLSLCSALTDVSQRMIHKPFHLLWCHCRNTGCPTSEQVLPHRHTNGVPLPRLDDEVLPTLRGWLGYCVSL